MTVVPLTTVIIDTTVLYNVDSSENVILYKKLIFKFYGILNSMEKLYKVYKFL